MKGTTNARLFDHTTSLPIRQGKLFPDSPPSSKKFGRSLGTIKVRTLSLLEANWQYRFDLAPVYVSHVYQQISQDLWAAGKSQSLGVKARFGRFRADAHQRAQEKTVRHEKLRRTTVVVHKPFYAADLLLDGIQLKGIRADFLEMALSGRSANEGSFPKASELSSENKVWFNFFDYIDADRKPLDRNPQVEIVDVGDCPQIFCSKRVKARQTLASDDDDSSMDSGDDSRLDFESSKFGHERSHICYLGAASGVGPTQLRITQERVSELEARLTGLSEHEDELMKASPDPLCISFALTLYDRLSEKPSWLVYRHSIDTLTSCRAKNADMSTMIHFKLLNRSKVLHRRTSKARLRSRIRSIFTVRGSTLTMPHAM